jgi:hypothetical protein
VGANERDGSGASKAGGETQSRSQSSFLRPYGTYGPMEFFNLSSLPGCSGMTAAVMFVGPERVLR